MQPAFGTSLRVGDQMQLKQPVQGALPGQSGSSALGYLPARHAGIPERLGISLGSSFRMHPKLCQFVSEMVYEDRLQSDLGNERRVLNPPTGLRWLLKSAG